MKKLIIVLALVIIPFSTLAHSEPIMICDEIVKTCISKEIENLWYNPEGFWTFEESNGDIIYADKNISVIYDKIKLFIIDNQVYMNIANKYEVYLSVNNDIICLNKYNLYEWNNAIKGE